MIKEVYQMTTNKGETFEVITTPIFNSRNHIRHKRALKDSINNALGLRLVRTVKYIGQVETVTNN